MVTDELQRRLLDIARAANGLGEARFSRFLEPPEYLLAQKAAHESGAVLSLFGGYGDAERRVAGFSSSDSIAPQDWPIACIRLRWNAKFASAGHRDVLGALMALGVERAMMGDIQMGEDCAYLFVLREIADYLCANMDSAGRAKLSADRIDVSEAQIAAPKGREFRVTISSMRLDALVAEGYDLSRSDAQGLIRRGLVKRNHMPCEKGDCRVEAGDMISVRGHGRLKFLTDLGETKKGRCAVRLFRYGE